MIQRTGTIRFVRASLTAFAVALLPCVATAQAAAVTGPPADSGTSLHFRAGAGIDLNWHDVKTANALIGAEWRRPGSRLSARFDLDYFRRDYQGTPSSLGSCAGYCTNGQVTQLFGGSVGGQFDLTTGRFRPYLFSGIGLYRSTSDLRMNGRCDGQFQCVLTPGEFSTFRSQSMSVGLHSGLGFSMKAGRSNLFTEFRFQSLTNAQSLSWHAPVTFGVRF